MQNFCKNCSHRSTESAKFCYQCGEKFQSETEKLPIAFVDEIETHTCWIGNISTQYDVKSLEMHLEEIAKKFGKVHSLKITQNMAHNFYQCFINFYEQKAAKEAVIYFNECTLAGSKLKSEHRSRKESNFSSNFITPVKKNLETYVCLIDNISTKYSDKMLEKHFEEDAKSFGKILSTKITLNNNVNQCEIHFLHEKHAFAAAKHFNGANFDGFILISKLLKKNDNLANQNRRLQSVDPLHKATSISSSVSGPPRGSCSSIYNFRNLSIDGNTKDFSTQHGLFKKQVVNDYDLYNSDSNEELSHDPKKIEILNSKHLRRQLEEKIKTIKDATIQIIEGKDLSCIVNCENELLYDKTFQKIKEWKVFQSEHKLKPDEFKLVSNIENELIKTCGNHEAFIHLNVEKLEIVVFSFDKDVLNFVLEKIKLFLETIVCKEQKVIHDNFHYDLLKKSLQVAEFLMKNNLDELKFEFKDPLIKENKIESGQITIIGKMSHILKVNYNRLFEIFSVKEHFYLNESSPLAFIKIKLLKMKCDLERKFVMLNFSEIKFKIQSYFELYGFDNFEVKSQAEEIKAFLSNAKSTSVKVRSFEVSKVKQLLEEFEKNDYEGNTNNHETYFHEKSRIIFINGTNEGEINQLKESIEKLLNGSHEINQKIKIKNFLFNKLVKQNSNIIKSLRENNKNVKIVSNLQKYIRVSGSSTEVQKVILEIEKLFDEFSSMIILKDIQIKESEFRYLLKQKYEIEKLSTKTSSIITIHNIKKYSSLKFSTATNNSVEVELCKGDLTEVCVDAYVNPINFALKTNEDFLKKVTEKLGLSVKNECDKIIRENSLLFEGSVFVTKSGDLGVKSNSIIIHAAGPIWKEGNFYEAQTLCQVVFNSLREANNHNCTSIVIPAISTDVYHANEAVDILTKTVIDFIFANKTSLKKIIFISKEESIVKKWELVLLDISNTINIKIESRALKNQNVNEMWYWKDHEGSWKAFALECNTTIESKFKEYKESNFLISKSTFKIFLNEQEYLFDFIRKKLVNLKSNFEHDLLNEIPNILKYQWNWLDDLNVKIPFSLLQSEMIEKGFKNGENCIEIKIKRNDNDNNEMYKFEFLKNSLRLKEYLKRRNIEADGIQINTRTKYIRWIFREEIKVKASIEYPEEDYIDDFEKNQIKVFISGEKENVENAIKLFQELLNDAYIEETMPLIELTESEIKNLEIQNNAKIYLKNNMLVIKGLPDAINKIKATFLEISTQNQNILYPVEWSPMENENLKICLLSQDSPEYKNIYTKVSKSVPSPNIVKIERIQNRWLWKDYINKTNFLKEKGLHNINERWLFYGTSGTEPSKIYDDEFGFHIKHSSPGLWGQGLYFANNAFYTIDGYSFKNSDGTESIFYARVALGYFVELEANNSNRIPPEKLEENKFAVEGYDSIKGNTGSSDIFIIFENSRAYPSYLITFRSFQKLKKQMEIMPQTLRISRSSGFTEDNDRQFSKDSKSLIGIRTLKEGYNILLNLNVKIKQSTIKIVDVGLNDKIKMLKSKIFEQTNIKTGLQILIFDDIVLDNDMKTIRDYNIENDSTIYLYKMTNDEAIWYNYRSVLELKREITVLGGKFEGVLFDLTVPQNSVNTSTPFCIKLSEEHFNKPNKLNYMFRVHKLTPVLEIQPHRTLFNKELTLTFKNIDSKFKNVYLFKQEYDEDDRFIDVWNCFFPFYCKQNGNPFQTFEFKLDRFSFVFLGNLQKGFDISCTELTNTEFTEKFGNDQHIRPGLNICMTCENRNCQRLNKLIIVNKYYGTFDIDPNKENYDSNNCLGCQRFLSNRNSFKNLIFFQSEFSIDITLPHKVPQSTKYSVTGNKLLIFGDELEREEYASLIIKVQTPSRCRNVMSYRAALLSESIEMMRFTKGISDIFNEAPNGYCTKFSLL